jgi:primosomal protein N' (replication factor Y)
MTKAQPHILRIAVPAPLRRYFDYLPPNIGSWQDLQPGVRIRVPFGRREMVGIFMGLETRSDVPRNKLKPALEIIDQEPVVPTDILELCVWAAEYYHYPIGEVLATALPTLLRQGKPLRSAVLTDSSSRSSAAPFVLNTAQQSAVSAIQAASGTFQVFLLDGVTGSGKTEVYLQAIAHILEKDQQVLVLLPEIGLTPQTIQRFRERFSVPIVTLNSSLTEKDRLLAWGAAKAGAAKIIIGTRSAVFSPLQNLGLIIVDEEHDLSFKQQEGFRYHARDLAIMRAHHHHIPIVLGSATPALETLHKAQQGRFHYLNLPQRAGSAQLPEFRVLDIRNQLLDQGLSAPLLDEIKQHLAQGGQVMLFLNRRGFSPVYMCHSCGWMVNCKRCDARMTYHLRPERLHCHHCDTQKKLPKQCEQCGGKELFAIGLGTERLEDALEKHFPDLPIARIDRDSTRRKGKMEEFLNQIQSGEARILIGTQMLAKGHHFPNVTLVAVVDADGGFFSSDFRALERMGQLLLQVAGRAGRMEKPGKVIIQTHHPDHPLLHQLLTKNYQHFAGALLAERLQACLPPYAFFALFRAEAHSEQHARDFLDCVKTLTDGNLHRELQILGPISAPLPKRAGRHRMQLLIQAKQRPRLQQFLKVLLPEIEKIRSKQKVRWSLDIDPLEMV